MSTAPKGSHYVGDPDAIRLTDALRELNITTAELAGQLRRLVTTHQAELTAKYGAQALLDFHPPRDDPRLP